MAYRSRACNLKPISKACADEVAWMQDKDLDDLMLTGAAQLLHPVESACFSSTEQDPSLLHLSTLCQVIPDNPKDLKHQLEHVGFSHQMGIVMEQACSG